MQRAVIYARFSSDMQREESIDAQVRACQEYCNKKHYQTEGKSNVNFLHIANLDKPVAFYSLDVAKHSMQRKPMSLTF